MDDLNLKMIGMLRVMQSFMPIMPRDWTGRIINISGIAGIERVHRRADARAQQLGDESRDVLPGADLAAEKITVNTVVPGLIATEWRQAGPRTWASSRASPRSSSSRTSARRGASCQGRWGTMEESRDLVTFLASDRAGYINGARIAFDGGYAINHARFVVGGR